VRRWSVQRGALVWARARMRARMMRAPACARTCMLCMRARARAQACARSCACACAHTGLCPRRVRRHALARTHVPPRKRVEIPLSTLLLTRAKGSSSTTIGLGLPGLAPCCPSSGAATIAPPASHRPGPGTTGAGAGARLLSRTLRSTPQLLSARSAPASARRSASRPHTEHPHADTGAVHALLLQLLSVGQPGRFVRHGNLICT